MGKSCVTHNSRIWEMLFFLGLPVKQQRDRHKQFFTADTKLARAPLHPLQSLQGHLESLEVLVWLDNLEPQHHTLHLQCQHSYQGERRLEVSTAAKAAAATCFTASGLLASANPFPSSFPLLSWGITPHATHWGKCRVRSPCFCSSLPICV